MSRIESLQVAILDNNLQQVQELIEAGVDVNEPLEDNCTVLMIAASHGYFSIVQLLVEAGADVDLISYHGDRAVGQAALGCWQEVFDYLTPLSSLELRKQAQENALLTAAADHDAEVVHLLAKVGTDLNATDEYGEGETALQKAKFNSHQEVFNYLLQLTTYE